MLLLFLGAFLWADLATDIKVNFAAVTEEADRLNEEAKHETVKEFLLKSLKTAQTDFQKSELYWRLARVIWYQADQAEKSGAKMQTLLEMFEHGEEYADKSIQYWPENPMAYFWKSSNAGRWGQTKGILSALFKASEVREILIQAIDIDQEYADAYNVLGQLYDQVPGLISFKNMDFAVSLGRKAIDLRERQVREGIHERLDYDYYTELAKHLYQRNWRANRRFLELDRKKEKLKSVRSIFDKACYYEATVPLKDMSDREEAIELVKWVVNELESRTDKRIADDDDLLEARHQLEVWNP